MSSTLLRYAQYAAAALFYVVLAFYLLSELYFNRAYWRLILREKRRKRWERLLWMERLLVIAAGLLVIFLTLRRI